MFVRFTSRETDCPVGGDKVWHECDYLQEADKVRSYEVIYMIIYISLLPNKPSHLETILTWCNSQLYQSYILA